MYAKLKKKVSKQEDWSGLPGKNVKQKVKRKVEGAVRGRFGTADSSRFDWARWRNIFSWAELHEHFTSGDR